MFTIITNLYINISFFCIFLYIIEMMLTHFRIGNMPDVWKMLRELQESLDEMENEKLKTFMNNLINSCIEFPINSIILVVVLSFVPIFHLLVIWSLLKSLKERFN